MISQLDARRGRGRHLALLLTLISMLCLSHTLEHRAIAGEHHHDEGDAAGATVELVILSFAAAFMAAAVGGCLRSQGPRSIVRPTIVTWVPSPVPTPTARAGPVVLGVSRT